jgi:hypothetical protein
MPGYLEQIKAVLGSASGGEMLDELIEKLAFYFT